jgi:hypothetical protein
MLLAWHAAVAAGCWIASLQEAAKVLSVICATLAVTLLGTSQLNSDLAELLARRT